MRGLRIIISPAKKMNVNTDMFPCGSLPDFLEDTEKLLRCLQSFTYEEVDKDFRIGSCRDIFVHYLEQIQKDLDRRD